MNFASALISMKHNHKVRRHHWEGYWYLDSNGEVIMHLYDGMNINLRNTNSMLYTLENIACDDWEICDSDHARKELRKEDREVLNNLDQYIDIDNRNSLVRKYLDGHKEEELDYFLNHCHDENKYINHSEKSDGEQLIHLRDSLRELVKELQSVKEEK